MKRKTILILLAVFIIMIVSAVTVSAKETHTLSPGETEQFTLIGSENPSEKIYLDAPDNVVFVLNHIETYSEGNRPIVTHATYFYKDGTSSWCTYVNNSHPKGTDEALIPSKIDYISLDLVSDGYDAIDSTDRMAVEVGLLTSLSDAKVTIPKASYAYTGKAIRPVPTVNVNGNKLVEGTDYTVTYSSNVKVSDYACMTIKGKGKYTGKTKKYFKIVKTANPIKVTPKTATVKYSKLKKKSITLVRKDVVTVSNAKGAVTCKKLRGNSKITVTSAGKVKIKKGLKKGTYRIKARYTAKGNANYKSGSRIVTFKLRIK